MSEILRVNSSDFHEPQSARRLASDKSSVRILNVKRDSSAVKGLIVPSTVARSNQRIQGVGFRPSFGVAVNQLPVGIGPIQDVLASQPGIARSIQTGAFSPDLYADIPFQFAPVGPLDPSNPPDGWPPGVPIPDPNRGQHDGHGYTHVYLLRGDEKEQKTYIQHVSVQVSIVCADTGRTIGSSSSDYWEYWKLPPGGIAYDGHSFDAEGSRAAFENDAFALAQSKEISSEDYLEISRQACICFEGTTVTVMFDDGDVDASGSPYEGKDMPQPWKAEHSENAGVGKDPESSSKVNGKSGKNGEVVTRRGKGHIQVTPKGKSTYKFEKFRYCAPKNKEIVCDEDEPPSSGGYK